ncbi:MAG TPA: peroxidase-related enzyme [Candidatus Omnitrophota bacterium]|nr:peroxidase-related enzyme [Candidatus Omnitrophota bacterium]HRY85791.1 peroxidase-related enzyme [Candidatus Omnitrophota bacterium]
MSRIQPLDPEKTQGKVKELLATIKAKSGRVPNIFKTMAHSSTALQAYLGFSGAFADAKLSAKVREQIALAVGEDNQCQYCLSAHSAIGKLAGLTPEEIESGRRAKSADPKTNAILKLAKKLSSNRGNITDAELAEARKAGCSDEEVLEIIAAVALNIFTNYINHVADTAVDFPQAPPLS